MKIGGRALSNGITYQSDNVIITATRNKENNIDVDVQKLGVESQKIKGKIETIIDYIPILRGIYSFVFTNGIWLMRLLIVSTIIMDILNQFNNNFVSNINLGLNSIYIVFTLGFFIFMIIKSRKFLQYHGAEHKIINAYENEKSIDINEIKKCSRVHYRCGTIFAIFFNINKCFNMSITCFK